MTEQEVIEKWGRDLARQAADEGCNEEDVYPGCCDYVRKIAADLRASTPPAAPAFSPEEMEALRGLKRFIEYRLANLQPAGPAKHWVALLDRLLASPAAECHDPSHQTCDPTPAPPLTVAPSRWMLRERTDEWVDSAARRLVADIGDAEWSDLDADEQSAVMEAVNNIYNGLAVSVPLTVASALALPEVRSGAKWIKYETAAYTPEAGPLAFAMRVSREDGAIETMAWTVIEDHGPDSAAWDREPFKPEEFDAECRLVDPEPAKEQTP